MSKPLFVWREKTLVRILPEQIAFLATEKNYTRIFMIDQSFFMVRATLSGAMKKLPHDMFIRIHRSFVVSTLHLESIHKDHVEVLGEPIPVARQYYQPLLSRLSVIS